MWAGGLRLAIDLRISAFSSSLSLPSPSLSNFLIISSLDGLDGRSPLPFFSGLATRPIVKNIIETNVSNNFIF